MIKKFKELGVNVGLAEVWERFENEPLLPRGWAVAGAIQWTEPDGAVKTERVLAVQSKKGGGSYAEAKLRTLLLRPRPQAYTTDVSLDEYRELICLATGPTLVDTVSKYAMLSPISERQCSEFMHQISAYTNLTDIPRSILDPIRDCAGISPFGGGVRIPCVLVQDGVRYPFDFLLSASGAKEAEDDALFALSVFKQYLITFELDHHSPVVEFRYDQLNLMLTWLEKKSPYVWRMVRLLADW